MELYLRPWHNKPMKVETNSETSQSNITIKPAVTVTKRVTIEAFKYDVKVTPDGELSLESLKGKTKFNPDATYRSKYPTVIGAEVYVFEDMSVYRVNKRYDRDAQTKAAYKGLQAARAAKRAK